MKAHSFQNGFMKGFFAPFTFFAPDPIRLPRKFNGSVDEAWADVGRLLNEALNEQRKYIEQTTDKKTKNIPMP